MKEKIKVIICTGTHCFVMGGSDLLLLEENLPEHLKENIMIEGNSCLEYCEDRSKGKAPFVEIDGYLLDQATIPKILNYIEELTNWTDR